MISYVTQFVERADKDNRRQCRRTLGKLAVLPIRTHAGKQECVAAL